MIIKSKLDRQFGPAGSSTGIVMIAGGLFATYHSYIGLILILFGAFIGFTSTSTMLDTDKRKIKFSNNLFGILPIGKWIDIEPEMMLGIKKAHKGYRTYSRSNRQLNIHLRDVRIVLYGSDKKPIMQMMKFDSGEAAKEELGKLSNQLKLSTI